MADEICKRFPVAMRLEETTPSARRKLEREQFMKTMIINSKSEGECSWNGLIGVEQKTHQMKQLPPTIEKLTVVTAPQLCLIIPISSASASVIRKPLPLKGLHRFKLWLIIRLLACSGYVISSFRLK
ncbi:hypothetical protein QVD17_21841 [Tagetes erecta]|uniref:Uncharacterized protein n=1 Tax=Tagetes erecta TaxID=13708 RepID=A0AAD8NLG2_TARER|nr:hypothetical protein QVD17_21841 [Tagetes erecta]